jgi:hypothetical protein
MIDFSYHKNCIGKPEKRQVNGRQTLWIGDQRINLGYGWTTTQLPIEEIYQLLSRYGVAFAPALTSDHRIDANFVSHQLALVDIDSGMTIDELKVMSFYQQYGTGYYTTPSHTEESHRFRILYQLPVPVTDAATMRVIYEGLLAVHGAADIACKDAVRLFYGTVEARHRELTHRQIDSDGLLALLSARDQHQARQIKPVRTQSTRTPVTTTTTTEQVAEILDELQRWYPALPYHQRLDVTWAVLSCQSPADTINLMRSRWPDAELNGKYEAAIDSYRRDELHLGTVVHMIRQHNPMYRRSVAYMSMQEIQDNLARIKQKQEKNNE